MTKYFSDTLNVLSNVTMVNELPFAWAATDLCLPSNVYDELVSTRPIPAVLGEEKNNERLDVNACESLKGDTLKPIWRDFVEYHTSQGFYHQVLDRFEGYFTDYYPQLKNMRDYKVGVRFRDDADIYLDCQFSINTAVKTKSTVAPPHIDNPHSLWASLLYMKEPDDDSGGDLVLHKCVRAPVFHGKRNAELEGVRPFKIIPYEKNSYACFINSPISVHSVTERDVTDKRRLMVNITLEFRDQKLFKV